MTDKDKIKKLKARVKRLEDALIFSDEIISTLSEMLAEGEKIENMSALDYVTLAALIAKNNKELEGGDR
ncbi:MAG: hypothetical protein LUD47_04135 [Clostridia bacterium]|nr:hypothetical protein [Clostridia bacterium]